MTHTYLLLSIVIGVVLVVDSLLLRKAKGRCGSNPILDLTSSIEFIWAILSIIALFKLEFAGWLILIPAIYVAHNVFGWLYGFLIISKKTNGVTGEIAYVPMWYICFGLIVELNKRRSS